MNTELQTKVAFLRRSQFFSCSEIVSSAQRMRKQLKGSEYSQASDRVLSSAFGACARRLSRSEEKTVAHDAIENSEALDGCQDATIAKAFMAEHSEWKECLPALAPLDSPEKVTAALLAVKHGTDTEQALQWLPDADFIPNDLDADGKAVLLSCQLEA